MIFHILHFILWNQTLFEHCVSNLRERHGTGSCPTLIFFFKNWCFLLFSFVSLSILVFCNRSISETNCRNGIQAWYNFGVIFHTHHFVYSVFISRSKVLQTNASGFNIVQFLLVYASTIHTQKGYVTNHHVTL